MEYQKLIKERRSSYVLETKSPVSDEVLLNRLGETILQAPTAFNSLATHIIICLNKNHSLVWDIVHQTLKDIVPPNRFKTTSAKLDLFKAGYGTILVFKDTEKIEELKKDVPTFSSRQDNWGEQNIGILVYALWLTLVDLGFGCNIQHYDPLIDSKIEKSFEVPSNWKLETEMVFGNKKVPDDEKDYAPLEERMKVFK